MKTYLISGTIEWKEHCDCSSCGGHWRDSEVHNFQIGSETLHAALATALSQSLSYRGVLYHSDAKWKEGYTVTIITEPALLTDKGLLIESAPKKLVERALKVGVHDYWNAKVERKTPIKKDEQP